jgi:hypothetical protein
VTTTIWKRANTALATLDLPMAAGLYITSTEESLPDEFLVYDLVADAEALAEDDDEALRSLRVQVSYYNRSGLDGMPDIKGAMKAAGFSRGPMRSLPYNPNTRHFGAALEFVYLEEE